VREGPKAIPVFAADLEVDGRVAECPQFLAAAELACVQVLVTDGRVRRTSEALTRRE
jgi:hypothetical protein